MSQLDWIIALLAGILGGIGLAENRILASLRRIEGKLDAISKAK